MSPLQRTAHMFHFLTDDLFNEFIEQHQKKYSSYEEFNERRKYFVDNLSNILRHRWEFNAGLHGHLLGVNSFADYSPQQLKSSCFKKIDLPTNTVLHQRTNRAIPSSFDWRTKG